jgi:hypothetical protein
MKKEKNEMDIRSEIERSIDLLKRDNNGRPPKAHRHLLYVIWKGNEEEIEKAIAMIRRAEFFAKLNMGHLEEYAGRQEAYWARSESKGEKHADYLG